MAYNALYDYPSPNFWPPILNILSLSRHQSHQSSCQAAPTLEWLYSTWNTIKFSLKDQLVLLSHETALESLVESTLVKPSLAILSKISCPLLQHFLSSFPAFTLQYLSSSLFTYSHVDLVTSHYTVNSISKGYLSVLFIVYISSATNSTGI